MNIFISHDTKDSYFMNALQAIINKTHVLNPIVIVRQDVVMQDFVEKVQEGIDKSYYFFPYLYPFISLYFSKNLSISALVVV